MDEHNVHHFWGISPGVDLASLASAEPSSTSNGKDPIRVLQVASYDSRHTLYTLCQAARHNAEHEGPVHIYVFEEEPEVLTRHLLLLDALLDGSLLAKERVETFLELHGNALLRDRTSKYLEQRARALEQLLVSMASSSSGGINQLLDLSQLKFQDKDKMVEVLQKCRETTAYDMVKAWDARLRKWYSDRYDFRINMIDWDYHMPLSQAGTPGQDPALGSIIHFHHFRYWRLHGIAYELRDSQYTQPNRTLLSTAYGRTKEFKDRSGKDVGRSVSAWGFWGDILNTPYHSYGTACEEPSFYKVTNKQFSRTAVDISEHNLMALLHELRTGQKYQLAEGEEAHRAKVARGPTSMADIQEEAAKQQHEEAAAQQQEQAQQAPKQQQQQQAGQQQEGSEPAGDAQQGQGDAASPAGQEVSSSSRPAQQPECSTSQGEASVGVSGDENRNGASGSSSQPSTSTSTSSGFIPAQAFQGAKAGYAFKAGAHGLGYYPDAAAPAGADTATAAAAQPAAAPAAGHAAASSTSTAPEAGSAAESAASSEAAAQASGLEEEMRKKMALEAEALHAEEAKLDAAAWSRLSRFRIIPVTGDLVKTLTGKSKFASSFDVVSVGHRHVHLLGPDYGLFKAAKPGGRLLVETAKYMLQLKKEQAQAFADKISELAKSSGWEPIAPSGTGSGNKNSGVTDAHMLFSRAA